MSKLKELCAHCQGVTVKKFLEIDWTWSVSSELRHPIYSEMKVFACPGCRRVFEQKGAVLQVLPELSSRKNNDHP